MTCSRTLPPYLRWPCPRTCSWCRATCRPRRCRRSEEHTSELQSPCNLVCRLLLEKKNHTYLFILISIILNILTYHSITSCNIPQLHGSIYACSRPLYVLSTSTMFCYCSLYSSIFA